MVKYSIYIILYKKQEHQIPMEKLYFSFCINCINIYPKLVYIVIGIPLLSLFSDYIIHSIRKLISNANEILTTELMLLKSNINQHKYIIQFIS